MTLEDTPAPMAAIALRNPDPGQAVGACLA